MRLNDRGQCCGRKPHRYKGGAWNSPPEAPMQVCHCCGAVYELDTGAFREWSSWTPGWKREAMEQRHGRTMRAASALGKSELVMFDGLYIAGGGKRCS